MHPLPTAFPDFGLTPEQRHEAVLGHYYEYPGMDGERGEIWCYTPRLLLSARRHGDAACQLDRQELPARDRPRRCSGNAGADDRQPDRALAGHARPMLGRGLRLGGHAGVYRRRRMAVRRLPHHADRRRPRRQADRLRPPHHRQAGAGQQARPHPAGRGDRHLDGLQHLGRLQPLSGHHRARARPVRAGREHRAAAGAAASSGCRRMRRACRWKSPCRR